MRSLPEGFDLSALIGRSLAQVRLDQHQVQLVLDVGHISVEGRLMLERRGEGSVSLFGDDGWVTSDGLEKLVGERVESWGSIGSHSFYVMFSSGCKLIFESQDGPYEDVVIQIGDNSSVLVL